DASLTQISGTDAVHVRCSNQLFSLDGDGDYARIPSAAGLQNSDALTVEAWINPIKYGRFINKGDGLSAASARSYEMECGRGSASFNVFLGLAIYANVSAPMTDNL